MTKPFYFPLFLHPSRIGDEFFYACKLASLNEINCSKIHKLLKLIEDEIGNLNNAPSIKEIKFIAKNLFRKKCPGPDSFAGKSELTFKEKITPIL